MEKPKEVGKTMSEEEKTPFSSEEILSYQNILDLPEGTFTVNEVYKTSPSAFEARGKFQETGTTEEVEATLSFVTNKKSWDDDVTAGELLHCDWYVYEID